MTLAELFPQWTGAPVSVAGLTLDSRQVSAGVLFLALPGEQHDGRDYIAQAVAAGACAIVYENADGFDALVSVPALGIAQLASQLSAIAGRFYADPAQHLGLIGVTGTNGKTSVSQMLAQALNLVDEPCGVIGTLGNGMLGALRDNGMTTPDALRVQAQLAQLRDQGAKRVSMEVSSHALVQGRVAALTFDIAVFTNLSRDHLDYHGDMTQYGAAKANLFNQARTAVINIDDEFGQQLTTELQIPVLSFSTSDPAANLYCSHLRFDATGIHARLHVGDQTAALHSPLLGVFNLSNLLAVAGSLLTLGFSLNDIAPLLAQLQSPPGRMQRLGAAGKPLIVIDYAHTPDALENALAALRAHVAGRLVCVFGCGGNRDSGKRPLMAQAATRGADHVVVTTDNPRTEPAASIIEEICAGIEQPHRATVIANRADAISQTIASAAANDVILLAGKGHETYQEIDGVRHPFSDIEQAERALQGWGKAS